MDSGNYYSGTAQADRTPGDTPTLPPIYLTIIKVREQSTVICSFNGNVIIEVDSTNYSASTSMMDRIAALPMLEIKGTT